MNGEIKQRWLDALRSGEYVQGSGALHRVRDKGDQFCCLGVLCDLAVKAGVIEEVDSGPIVAYGDEREIHILPDVVMEWAGLDRPNPNVARNGHDDVLVAELNDKGVPFDVLADRIEALL